jgi:hypothetical protein
MALILNEGDLIEIEIETEEEPCPVLILTAPSDQAVDEFERNRTKIVPKRHGKLDVEIDYDLEIKFINDRLVGCDKIEVMHEGKAVALDTKKFKDWKERIPTSWKRKAASYFIGGEAVQKKAREGKK